MTKDLHRINGALGQAVEIMSQPMSAFTTAANMVTKSSEDIMKTTGQFKASILDLSATTQCLQQVGGRLQRVSNPLSELAGTIRATGEKQ
jgi:hypothetical protein